MELNPEFSISSEWEIEKIGKHRATFNNNDRGLEVTIRAVYPGSRVRKHPRRPSHYVVRLQQGWFSRDSLDTHELSAKVDSEAEAFTVASDFMEEFNSELDEIPSDEVEAIHRATGEDHDAAEQIITTQLAAEAFADSAGYSDELLLDVVAAGTNDQYECVAHREGDIVEIIGGDDATFEDGISLETLHAVFPIDKSGIEQVLTESLPVTMVVHLGKSTIYRFVFDDARETDIVLPRGTQVTSPEFETTIRNVLEEKW